MPETTTTEPKTISMVEVGRREERARELGYSEGYSAARGEFDTPAAWAVVMELWHNDHHAGPFRFCYEEPCKDLRGDTHS